MGFRLRRSGRDAPARRRAWPLGLIGALAIAGAAEAFIGGRAEDFGSMLSIEWRWAGEKIRREAKGSRVLCFGSSFTRMGVAATVLEERLGLPSYNFAISGAQPFAHYAALRRALDAGATPEAIVVDFAWTTLARPDDWNAPVLPEFATFSECAEFAIAARSPTLLGRLAVAKALPSFRRRDGVREAIGDLVRGSKLPRNFLWPYMARNGNVNRGSVLATPKAQVGVELNDPVTFQPDWSCSPVAERYAGAFLALAESRGIPVFWLISPISPQAQARRDALGLDAPYTAFVERLAARHRGVVVVDGRGARYGAEAFVDMVHLNRDGAVAMSADLADVIRDRLVHGPDPATSWSHLPDHRHDPLAARVEDFDGSCRELQRIWSRGLTR